MSVDLELSKTKQSPSWKDSLTYSDLPTENVSLRATTSNAATKIDYYFYCNRSDPETNLTDPKDDTILKSKNTVEKDDQLCLYDTPGTYTAKVIIVDKKGKKAQDTATITVNGTLGATLSANPTSGTSPVSSVLTASATGTEVGTINYSFWYDCTDGTTSVADANTACGTLTTPSAGSCVETVGIGSKCDGITDNPKSIPAHTYTTDAGPTIYIPKVIVERGAVLPAQAQASVTVNPNGAPTVALQDTEQLFCNNSGKHATLHWTYTDDNSVISSMYQIKVYQGASLIQTYNRSDGAILFTIPPADLAYGTTYTATIQAWDAQGAASNIITTPAFSTLAYDKPHPDFTWSSNPKVGKPVQFTDTTTYGNGVPPYTYDWNFACSGNCTPGTSSDQNPTTTFFQSANYNVTLKVQDTGNGPLECSSTKSVNIGGSYIPRWREIAPF
ncbi:MAG: PKD domain-containing protein [Patescibacteria group bacterium]